MTHLIIFDPLLVLPNLLEALSDDITVHSLVIAGDHEEHLPAKVGEKARVIVHSVVALGEFLQRLQGNAVPVVELALGPMRRPVVDFFAFVERLSFDAAAAE